MTNRTKHPYIMYDSLQSTPDMLKQCLNSPIKSQVQTLANAIKAKKIRRIIFTGCGTSLMIAQCCVHFITAWTDLDAVAESAFELQNYPTIHRKEDDMVIGFSHTGGTKAVVDYIKECRQSGALTAGFMEVKDSRLAQAAEFTVIGPGGKDGATPKTRSFSTGILLGAMLALMLSEQNVSEIWDQLNRLPCLTRNVLDEIEDPIKLLAHDWLAFDHFVVVGSGTNYIAAREGSLKFLESANTPAIGIQIEELAHGNELYLDETWGAFFLAPKDCKGQVRMGHDLAGVACAGPAITVLSAGNNGIEELLPENAGRIISLKESLDEILSIFLLILPLQLFAYYSTLLRGKNPDLASAVKPAMAEAIKKFHPPGFH